MTMAPEPASLKRVRETRICSRKHKPSGSGVTLP